MLAVAGLVAVAAVTVATAGGVNWKHEVRQECKRLVTNARWVYKADSPARHARLKRTAKACGMALKDIPGN